MIIEYIILNLDDVDALAEASRPRNEDDYNPNIIELRPFTIPVNILRSLLNEKSITHLKYTIEKIGIKDTFRLKIIKYKNISAVANDNSNIPIHLVSEFDYKIKVRNKEQTLQIVGPVFISLLHKVLTMNVPVEIKREMVIGVLEEHLSTSGTNSISVISMPKRKDTSLTHEVLLSITEDSMYKTMQVGEKEFGFYFFVHKKENDLIKDVMLLDNDDFFDKLVAIARAWDENFSREIKLAIDLDYMHQQAELVAHNFINSWYSSRVH